MAQRKYDGSEFGVFTEPVLWSKWGEKGQDGNGVQYIFKVSANTSESNPTPNDWRTNTDYQEESGELQTGYTERNSFRKDGGGGAS